MVSTSITHYQKKARCANEIKAKEREREAKKNVNEKRTIAKIKISKNCACVVYDICVITAYYRRRNVCECQSHFSTEKEGSLHWQLIFMQRVCFVCHTHIDK